MISPGIVLLAHGSRGEKIEGARLKEITSLLVSKLGNGNAVQPAFLQFNRPNLEDAIGALFRQGVKDVVVLPYLLFEGTHYHQHIPEELVRLAALYPGLTIKMARSLGVDGRILDIVKERLAEISPPSPDSAATMSNRSTIEEESFEQIGRLFPELDNGSPEAVVRRRVLHATANPDIAFGLKFHPRAIAAGIAALRSGTPIIVDVRMVEAGITSRLAGALGCPIFCAMTEKVEEAPPAVATTRTAAGIRHLASSVPGSVAAIGNAPTALLALLDMIDHGTPPPALIVGTPVGFIQAAESKAALMEDHIPYISLPGRMGGTPVAVSIVNALLRLAADANPKDPDASV